MTNTSGPGWEERLEMLWEERFQATMRSLRRQADGMSREKSQRIVNREMRPIVENLLEVDLGEL